MTVIEVSVAEVLTVEILVVNVEVPVVDVLVVQVPAVKDYVPCVSRIAAFIIESTQIFRCLPFCQAHDIVMSKIQQN